MKPGAASDMVAIFTIPIRLSGYFQFSAFDCKVMCWYLFHGSLFYPPADRILTRNSKQ